MVADRAQRVMVVALDLSEASAKTLQTALEIYREQGQSPLHVVYVAGGFDPMKRLELAFEAHQVELDQETQRLRDYLTEQLGHSQDASVPELELHVLSGPPAKEIVRVARSVGADLLVVGTHGRRGVRRLVPGSVAEEVLRSAPCPVLVVRGKDWAASA